MSGSESVCGSLSSCSSTSVMWQIEKQYLLGKQVGEFVTSPIFHVFNVKWQANIFPKGMNEECKSYTSVVLQILSCVKPVKLRIVSELSYENGTIYEAKGGLIVEINQENTRWRLRNMCSYDDFTQNYLNNSETTKCNLSFQFLLDDYYTRVPQQFSFGQALNNQQYSDVKFTVEGKNIYAHKIVLANKSKVFAAMFEHQMKENLKGEVEVDDVEYSVLIELFRYIYTGIVNDIEKFAKPLMIASDKYDLIDLKADCSKYLEENITVNSVQDCLDLAERHNVDSLKNKAVEFIKSNANEMVQAPDVFKSIMESHPDVVLEVFHCLSAKKPRLE